MKYCSLSQCYHFFWLHEVLSPKFLESGLFIQGLSFKSIFRRTKPPFSAFTQVCGNIAAVTRTPLAVTGVSSFPHYFGAAAGFFLIRILGLNGNPENKGNRKFSQHLVDSTSAIRPTQTRYKEALASSNHASNAKTSTKVGCVSHLGDD